MSTTSKTQPSLPFANVPRMTGNDSRPRIKADELAEKLFLVTGYREAKGEYGEYLYTTVEVDGVEFVFLCGQAVLMAKLREVKEFPVLCYIRKITLPDGKACWVFVDPDNPNEDPFEGE
jgi:hypothetical protein